MSAIDDAIVQLESEIAAFQQGTPQQPKDDTQSWFILRARVLGLTYLKQLRIQGLHNDPAAAERTYRGHLKAFKAVCPKAVEDKDGSL